MLQAYYIVCKTIAPCLPKEVECVCNHSSAWVPVIWALIVIISVALVLCYLHNRNKLKMKKEMADNDHQHELELKDKVFEHEKEWAHFKDISVSTDEALKKRVIEMEQTISSLNNQLKHEQEKNELSNKLLSSYDEIFKKLRAQIVASDEKQ